MPADDLRSAPDVCDLLIIGGGIVGAGCARDAALRGLSTVLVEQGDFASGTSSRTSRLLHGGLRYLAQGRVFLVREASREKKILTRIAPHLSQPLPFLFPTRRKSSWSRWKLGLGVKAYDLLCGGTNLGPSSVLSKEEMLESLPGLNRENLTGGVRYYDGLTCDARLVIDTLRSAAAAGAHLANYVRFDDAHREGNHWVCSLSDTESGDVAAVAARTVINATGPWADKIPNSDIQLRVTKGVHLVVDRQRLPVPNAVVMPDGARILFAIPWGERVILGTTDTDYTGPLDRPVCDPEDAASVLEVAERTFPEAALEPGDVISTWAGLRPLVADPQGRPSDISRRHEITSIASGWWNVAGGKLTTYRLMAEQTINRVARHLELDAPQCSTAERPLLAPEAPQATGGVLPAEVSREAVQQACRDEWAVHLDDVLIRRTEWWHYHTDRERLARQVAGWMAEIQSWPAGRIEEEIARLA